MKKQGKALLISALIVLMLVTLTGCVEIAEALSSVNGTVVDARTANLTGLEGVTVELVDMNGTVVSTDETDVDGDFFLSYPSEGQYTVRGTIDNYVVIPLERIYIGGWAQTVGNVIALSIDSASDISIVALWEDDFMDVDSYLTYPADGGDGLANYGAANFTSLQEVMSDSWTGVTTGFGPNTRTNREVRYFDDNNKNDDTTFQEASGKGDVTYAGQPVISMDRDDRDGSGPETMIIRYVPYWNESVSSYSMAGNGELGLPAATAIGEGTDTYGNWACVGLGEYYIDSYSQSGSVTEGNESLNDANVHVYVTQGTNVLAHSVLGANDISASSVYRIGFYQSSNNFYYLVFYPDERIMPADSTSSDFRSATAVQEPFGVPMGRR